MAPKRVKKTNNRLISKLPEAIPCSDDLKKARKKLQIALKESRKKLTRKSVRISVQVELSAEGKKVNKPRLNQCKMLNVCRFEKNDCEELIWESDQKLSYDFNLDNKYGILKDLSKSFSSEFDFLNDSTLEIEEEEIERKEEYFPFNVQCNSILYENHEFNEFEKIILDQEQLMFKKYAEIDDNFENPTLEETMDHLIDYSSACFQL